MRMLNAKCKLLIVAGCLVVAAVFVRAQTPAKPKPYKVVFDLTSDDPADQGAVVRWLKEVGSVNPETDMEVVMYGRGLALVHPGKTSQLEEVKSAIARPHVSFKVCEISLRNQKVNKSELLPNVGTVPDGIEEIVTKQKAGWGYIKAVH